MNDRETDKTDIGHDDPLLRHVRQMRAVCQAENQNDIADKVKRE
jgi:hypothetical protein